jgi:hypothetical protein
MGLLDLNVHQMEKLMRESNSGMIVWAFRNGRYDVRYLAVNYFGKIESDITVPMLQEAVDDEVDVVSLNAMSQLEKLSDDPVILNQLERKREYWRAENAHREKRRNRSHKKQSVLTESKERGSKKTLDNVRNMLKKPMIGGKWF